MITMTCTNCGQQLNIPERFAGQKGTCKHCQAPMTVPALPGADGPPERAEEFAGFNIMHDDHTQPSYIGQGAKPQTTIKKPDRAPRETNWLFLGILGAILVVGGGVVLVSFVYANLDGAYSTTETSDTTALASPVAGKSIEEVIEFLDAYKQIAWYEVDGNNVHIGWDFATFPKSGNLSTRVSENTAIIVSQAVSTEVTVYLLDASAAHQGWKPGGAGLKFQVGSLQGEVTEKKTI